MKVALVGIGHWGKVLLSELKKQTEVKYECTPDNNNLSLALEDSEVEAIFIATPTKTHFEIAELALQADKHVFLEKPGTTCAKDLNTLVALAKDKKIKFAVGYEYAHHPVLKKLKELLNGTHPTSIRFEWHKWGTFKDSAVPHLLSHEISIAKALGLTLKPVSCKKIPLISDSDIVETLFEGNISSLINRVSPFKQKVILISTDQTHYVWSNDELFEIRDEALHKIDIPEITSVAAEIRDFLSAITDDQEPYTNGSFALEVYDIIEQV